MGGCGRYDDVVNSETRAVLPRVLSLMPCLTVLNLGVRLDIDQHLSWAIQAHPSIKIATIEYTENLSFSCALESLSKVQLKRMSLTMGNYALNFMHMQQYLACGAGLSHLSLSDPCIIRNGFQHDLTVPGLCSLEISIQNAGESLGPWLLKFVEKHSELSEIQFRDNSRGLSWVSTPDILCARDILEATERARLSDAVSLLDITIKRPLPATPSNRDFNTWTVTSLALCVSSSASEVLCLMGNLCPHVTCLTLNMACANELSIHPVCVL